MSAWYVFSALGFYPVCPGGTGYAIGSPPVKRAAMHLSNGRTFTMTAAKLSEKNVYIQSARLNGREWNSFYLPYDEMKDGGSIEFVMGPRPNERWGTLAGTPR